MVAKGDLVAGSDVTPLIPPLVCCLNDSNLLLQCSACFGPLDDSNQLDPTSKYVRYCSRSCESVDLPLHRNSGEEILLKMLEEDPTIYKGLDSITLRLALRFLHIFPPDSKFLQPFTHPGARLEYFPNRILSLFYHEYDNNNVAPYLIFTAKSEAGSYPSDYSAGFDYDLEKLVLSLVETNVMDVNRLGQAVYDYRISMIDHSCSPNSNLLFSFHPVANTDEVNRMEITPLNPLIDKMLDQISFEEIANEIGLCSYGPRATVKLITPLAKGKEITISYVNSHTLKQKWKDSYLLDRFKVSCYCNTSKSRIPDEVVDELAVGDYQPSDSKSRIPKPKLNFWKKSKKKIISLFK